MGQSCTLSGCCGILQNSKNKTGRPAPEQEPHHSVGLKSEAIKAMIPPIPGAAVGILLLMLIRLRKLHLQNFQSSQGCASLDYRAFLGKTVHTNVTQFIRRRGQLWGLSANRSESEGHTERPATLAF